MRKFAGRKFSTHLALDFSSDRCGFFSFCSFSFLSLPSFFALDFFWLSDRLADFFTWVGKGEQFNSDTTSKDTVGYKTCNSVVPSTE